MSKVIIYQIFTRLFGNKKKTCKQNGTYEDNGCGKMSFFDKDVLKQIKDLGVTHVWYTGIIRHASKTSYAKYGLPKQHPAIVKGTAGSPYAIVDYYDVDPDLADHIDKRMDEFNALVKRTHQADLKVIIDFVPNHVARQYHSIEKPKGVIDLGEKDDVNMHFSVNNNFYYCTNAPFSPHIDLYAGEAEPYTEFPAKATGNDCFNNSPDMNDWYETVKLNYGIDYCDAGGKSEHFSPIPDTWFKMRKILLFWAAKGIDGFRCDMAEMVPWQFWKWAIAGVKKLYPDIVFIGEVYNPSLYRTYIASGFDYLYDKVGMYDCMKEVICHRQPASAITPQWQAVDDIHQHILYFLENHDEQRIASPYFAGNALKAIPAVAVNALMRENPFMIYAGQEYGEPGMDHEGFSGTDGRTTIFDYWTVKSLFAGYINRKELTTEQKQLEALYTQILNIAKTEKSVSDGLFFDVMYANYNNGQFDAASLYAFIRKYKDEMLIVVANFSANEKECSLRLPQHAFDYLQLPEGDFDAKELLSSTNCHFSLMPDGYIPVHINGNSASILKFAFK